MIITHNYNASSKVFKINFSGSLLFNTKLYLQRRKNKKAISIVSL